MKAENQIILTLDESDVQAAAVNGGTPVDLPVGTTRVILRVAPSARNMVAFPPRLERKEKEPA